MLKFFNDVEKGQASLYSSFITFNKSLIKYFENIYMSRVAIDNSENKIYVFLYDKDQVFESGIPKSEFIKVAVSKTYARICSKSLMEYISEELKLNIPDGSYLRYNASYNISHKAIIIEIGV